jgi:hypothetical protein
MTTTANQNVNMFQKKDVKISQFPNAQIYPNKSAKTFPIKCASQLTQKNVSLFHPRNVLMFQYSTKEKNVSPFQGSSAHLFQGKNVVPSQQHSALSSLKKFALTFPLKSVAQYQGKSLFRDAK